MPCGPRVFTMDPWFIQNTIEIFSREYDSKFFILSFFEKVENYNNSMDHHTPDLFQYKIVFYEIFE